MYMYKKELLAVSCHLKLLYGGWLSIFDFPSVRPMKMLCPAYSASIADSSDDGDLCIAKQKLRKNLIYTREINNLTLIDATVATLL